MTKIEKENIVVVNDGEMIYTKIEKKRGFLVLNGFIQFKIRLQLDTAESIYCFTGFY